MDTPLTTFDGFPRNDIDVAQSKASSIPLISRIPVLTLNYSLVRTTRVRIIHLRNDHKEVMKFLEKGLHEHFANLQRAQGTAATGADNTATAPTQRPAVADTSVSDAASLGTPFAKVNSVVPGSPADQAGLKASDTIRSFGNVNWMNHERLSKVAETVQQNEGVCRFSVLVVCHSIELFFSNLSYSEPYWSRLSENKTLVPVSLQSWICNSYRAATGVAVVCWAAIWFHCEGVL